VVVKRNSNNKYEYLGNRVEGALAIGNLELDGSSFTDSSIIQIAFTQCCGLLSIELKNVSTIGSKAFSYCKNLIKITLTNFSDDSNA
jgi:hypothetical protein